MNKGWSKEIECMPWFLEPQEWNRFYGNVDKWVTPQGVRIISLGFGRKFEIILHVFQNQGATKN